MYPNTSSLNSDGTSYWGLGVPAWIKSSRRVFGGTLDSQITLNASQVKEVYSSAASSPGPMQMSRTPGSADLAFSILETPDLMPDVETTEKFRSAFAYDEKEILLGCKCLDDFHEMLLI
jgi:sterol 3beta-glucosyltransferase